MTAAEAHLHTTAGAHPRIGVRRHQARRIRIATAHPRRRATPVLPRPLPGVIRRPLRAMTAEARRVTIQAALHRASIRAVVARIGDPSKRRGPWRASSPLRIQCQNSTCG